MSLEESPPVDVVMATFNSSHHLEQVLRAVHQFVPVRRLIVVDRFSDDGSAEIARAHHAEVFQEDSGVGGAYLTALRRVKTDRVLFVDSDVVIQRPDFYPLALRLLNRPRTAAVVGQAIGHHFLYGLPLSLTLVRRDWALKAGMSLNAQGQETMAFRRTVRRDRLRVRYVPDAMVHHSVYRQAPNWPEWQGAQTRLQAGLDPRELLYSFMVILLMHMNSRRPRHIAYTPVFYVKFLRGYFSPGPWREMDRRRMSLA